jgi:hypothetical protein
VSRGQRQSPWRKPSIEIFANFPRRYCFVHQFWRILVARTRSAKVPGGKEVHRDSLSCTSGGSTYRRVMVSFCKFLPDDDGGL